jgi:hypothetical protein
MFGFGRSKCSQCGEALESMGQSGDRTDDLMKSSAIGGKQIASGLCARCRAIASAGPKHRAPAPTPLSALRIDAGFAESKAKDAAPVFEPTGGFKTEAEQQAARDNPVVFANVSDFGTFLVWLITTKAGRNVAAIGFVLLFFTIPRCSSS